MFAIAVGAGLTLSIWLVAGAAQTQTPPDVDMDGVPDDQDNCIVLGGPAFQTDTDQDGFGNACDPDYDQDGFVLGSDVEIFFTTLGLRTALTDHTGDGIVLGDDYEVLRSVFNQVPFAVSGLACADPTGAGGPCLP